MTRCRRRSLWSAAGVLAMLSLGGCAQIGAVFGIVAQAVPRYVEPAYKGLAGQQVIVMVWADQKVRLDYPDLQEDVAAALQNKLIEVQAAEKPDGMKDATFPVSTATVIQYQQDHPETEFQPVTDVASQFQGTRLVYVEVTDFSTRSDASLELYQGKLSATLRVVEMTEPTPGKVAAKVGYDGGMLSVMYPPKELNKDGLPGGTDSVISQKTVQSFVDDATKRFYKHEEERT